MKLVQMCVVLCYLSNNKASVCAVKLVFEINYEHVAFNVSSVASFCDAYSTGLKMTMHKNKNRQH